MDFFTAFKTPFLHCLYAYLISLCPFISLISETLISESNNVKKNYFYLNTERRLKEEGVIVIS